MSKRPSIPYYFRPDVPFKTDKDSQKKLTVLRKKKAKIPVTLLSERKTTVFLFVTLPKALTSQKKRAEIIKIHTGKKIYPKDWDFESRLPRQVKGETSDMRIELKELDVAIDKAITRYINTHTEINKTVLANDLKKVVLGNMEEMNTNNFWDVWEKFVNHRGMTRRTIQKYDTYKNVLSDFEKEEKYIVSFDNINAVFLTKYVTYLRTKRDNRKLGKDENGEYKKGLFNNTIHKYLMDLKTFLHWAFTEQCHKNTYYEKINTEIAPKDDVDPVSLEYEEFLQLYRHIPSTQELQEVKDCFISQTLTSQRIGDFSSIERSDIQNNVWKLYQKKGRKTRVLEVPFHPIVVEIIEKYKHLEKPFPTPKEYNILIKELCKEAGITELYTKVRNRGDEPIKTTKPKYQFISTHSARKTFINIAGEMGVSPEVYMSITGHTNYKTIMNHYRKVKLKQKQEVMEGIKLDIEPIMKVAK